MASPPEGAVRRLTVVWTASTLVKLAAIAVFLFVVVRLAGGAGR
jgi:hypothetical protein